jgi:hypothetical protein
VICCHIGTFQIFRLSPFACVRVSRAEVGLVYYHGIYLHQGVNSMPRKTSPKKVKIILLLKQGETSSTIIANRVGCDAAYVNVVKREFLRSQKA